MKIRNISKETKATLEVLIAQIQQALKNVQPVKKPYEIENAVEEVLNEWIRGNKLHPENVQNFQQFSSGTYQQNFAFSITATTDSLDTQWWSCSSNQ